MGWLRLWKSDDRKERNVRADGREADRNKIGSREEAGQATKAPPGKIERGKAEDAGKDFKYDTDQVLIDPQSNKTAMLLKNVRLGEFKWVLKKENNWLTENRTWYFLNKEGELVFVQLGYTDPGWPVGPNCQLSARYFDTRKALEKLQSWTTCAALKKPRAKSDPARGTDGHVSHSATHKANKLQILDGGTGMELGKHIKIKADEKKQEVMVECQGDLVSIRMRAEVRDGGVCAGDGRVRFGMGGADGEISMKFMPVNSAEGTVTVDGVERAFRGSGLGVHQIQAIRPNLIANRWYAWLFVSDPDAKGQQTICFAITFSTPSSYDEVNVGHGMVWNNQKGFRMVCRDTRIVPLEPVVDEKSGYQVPKRLDVSLRGSDEQGGELVVKCSFCPSVICERLGLLDLLPFVARKVVETFFSKPFIYQWVDRMVVDIQEEGKEAEQISGMAYSEIVILDEA